MGTKRIPGQFDCYNNALPDEPIFVLLGRDPEFANLVLEWATHRQNAIRCGERPDSDMALVFEARQCALKGAAWRKDNNGIWRK